MTAIAGIIQFDGRPVDRATLERMQNVLAPYGRDAGNIWHQGTAGLVRTLLRTTPEDAFDRQPLVHPASGHVLLFDGRLDNRDDLMRELGLPVAEARDWADSELVLHAFLRWGEDAAARFVGAFAIAFWAPRQQKLWLARDPLGHRPLFWHRNGSCFAFATLAKGLFAVPGIPRAICEERVSDLLTLIPMVGPESFFKDVFRVEPGQVVTVTEGRVFSRRYYRFDSKREIRLASDDEYLEAFRAHLDQAVTSQLRSNGPIGSTLSSGFDSSTVTAVAARLLAAQGRRLCAFTSVPREGFDGPVPRGSHANEGAGAAALAAKFPNIDHVLIQTVGTSPLDHLQRDTEALDRAPLNPCNMVWMDAIDQAAADRGMRVVLNGAMGNMTLSYTGVEYLPALFGRGHWRRWLREVRALKRTRPQIRWRSWLYRSLAPFLPAWLWLAMERARDGDLKWSDYSAIHPAFANQIGSLQRAKKVGWDLSYRPWADGRRMRIAGLNFTDSGEHNLQANLLGLDSRDPTSDLRLVEFCLAVPDHQYLRDGQTRWLLKRLMDGVLPPEITQARSTGIQAADWYVDTTAAVPAIRETLLNWKKHPEAARYLDLDVLLKDLEDWPDQGWANPRIIQKYRLKLLRGLSVGTFVQYVDDRN